MSDTVIAVENLSKEYRLGTISHGTLYRDFQSFAARVLGREDPHAIVDAPLAGTGGGRFSALSDVSFEVKRGEVVGIVGRNGAGKSTLLKILSRVTAPTRGEVRIRGRVASLLEVGTGFHPELTGRENIYLNGAILGMTKREIDGKFDEIVDFAEVGQFIDTPVKRYSSGMHVRLAFAVAAHLEPEILIVDEVLAVGDAHFQKKCLGKMQDASSREGRTVLFVSHNMGVIKNLCNVGIYLNEGRIERRGSIEEVIQCYCFKDDQKAGICLFPEEADAGEVRLRSLGIRDPHGSGYLDTVPFQAPFSVEVAIESQAEVEAVVGIGIVNHLGEIVSTMHTVELGDEAGRDPDASRLHPGRNNFLLKINSNVLRPGRYGIGCSVFNRQQWKTFDERHDCLRFEITNHNEKRYFDERQQGAFFLHDAHWERIC